MRFSRTATGKSTSSCHLRNRPTPTIALSVLVRAGVHAIVGRSPSNQQDKKIGETRQKVHTKPRKPGKQRFRGARIKFTIKRLPSRSSSTTCCPYPRFKKQVFPGRWFLCWWLYQPNSVIAFNPRFFAKALLANNRRCRGARKSIAGIRTHVFCLFHCLHGVVVI